MTVCGSEQRHSRRTGWQRCVVTAAVADETSVPHEYSSQKGCRVTDMAEAKRSWPRKITGQHEFPMINAIVCLVHRVRIKRAQQRGHREADTQSRLQSLRCREREGYGSASVEGSISGPVNRCWFWCLYESLGLAGTGSTIGCC